MLPKIFLPLLLAFGLLPGAARAELPTGYLVWIHGDEGDRTSRKIHRLTLPDLTAEIVLSSGEDVECLASPDGKWVAYAKAKLPDTDYHQFNRWKLYLVSIHGVGDGREEIKIDDDGYWPSWGGPNLLYYSQVDPDNGQHTRIIKVRLDDYGNVVEREVLFSTASAFSSIREVNECFVAPDESWFAARTRGSPSVTGTGAFAFDPPDFVPLAKAGSVGCMPVVAPAGDWAVIAGRDQGLRWGDGPHVADRQEDQLLVGPRAEGDLVYHPGFSSDGQWVLAAHSSADDHNSGPYDVYMYALSPDRTVDAGQLVAGGDFNGWPNVWVGEPSDPPAPRPHVDAFYPDSYTVLSGEQVSLSWLTSFADLVSLDGSPVDPDGQASFTLQASARYVLVAGSSFAEGEDEAGVDITVNDTPQPVQIEFFAAEQAAIVEGSSTEISWRVLNATTLDLDQERIAPEGSLEVSPLADTVYVLTAQGHQGPVSQSLTVVVDPLGDLLPDRGGCFCSSTRPGGLVLGLVICLGLLAWAKRRWFRSRGC